MPTSTTLDDIFNMSTADIPEEISLPHGTWRFTVKALTSKEDKAGEPYALLTLQPVEPCIDVDADEARTWEAEGDDDAVVFHRVRGGKRAIGAQLKRLAELTGADSPANLIGKDLFARVTYDPNDQNPSRPWQRVSDFAPLTKELPNA